MPCTYDRLSSHVTLVIIIPSQCSRCVSGGVTPVPIPNTAVKTTKADGTRTQSGPGRVGSCREQWDGKEKNTRKGVFISPDVTDMRSLPKFQD